MASKELGGLSHDEAALVADLLRNLNLPVLTSTNVAGQGYDDFRAPSDGDLAELQGEATCTLASTAQQPGAYRSSLAMGQHAYGVHNAALHAGLRVSPELAHAADMNALLAAEQQIEQELLGLDQTLQEVSPGNKPGMQQAAGVRQMRPLSQMLIPVTIPTSPPAAMLHAPGMQYYAMPGPGGQPAAMASPPGVQTYLMLGQPYPQHMVMRAPGMNAPGVPAQTGRVPLAAAQTRQPVSVVLPSSSGQPGVPVIAHYRPLNVAQAGMAVRAPPLQPSYGAGAPAPPLPQENYHHHHYQQQQAQSQQPPMLQQERPLAQGMSPQAVSQASVPGTPTRHSPSSEALNYQTSAQPGAVSPPPHLQPSTSVAASQGALPSQSTTSSAPAPNASNTKSPVNSPSRSSTPTATSSPTKAAAKSRAERDKERERSSSTAFTLKSYSKYNWDGSVPAASWEGSDAGASPAGGTPVKAVKVLPEAERTARLAAMYARNQEWAKRLEDRRRLEREAREAQVLAPCTFSPKIDRTSKLIMQGTPAAVAVEMLCRRWPSDPGSVKAGTDPGVVGVQGLSLEETATVEDLLAAAAAGRPLNMPLSPTREDSREGELESEDSRAAAAFGSIPSMRSPEQHAGGHGSATQELSTGGMSGVSAAWTATRAGNPGPYRDPQVSHDSRVSPAVYEETGARLYARAAEMRARAEARALAAAAEQDGRRHFVASIDVQPRVFNASEPKHAKHLPTGMEECTFHPRTRYQTHSNSSAWEDASMQRFDEGGIASQVSALQSQLGLSPTSAKGAQAAAEGAATSSGHSLTVGGGSAATHGTPTRASNTAGNARAVSPSPLARVAVTRAGQAAAKVAGAGATADNRLSAENIAAAGLMADAHVRLNSHAVHSIPSSASLAMTGAAKSATGVRASIHAGAPGGAAAAASNAGGVSMHSICPQLDWDEFVQRQQRFLAERDAKVAAKAVQQPLAVGLSPGSKKLLRDKALRTQPTGAWGQGNSASNSAVGAGAVPGQPQGSPNGGAMNASMISSLASAARSGSPSAAVSVSSRRARAEAELYRECTHVPQITRKAAERPAPSVEQLMDGGRARKQEWVGMQRAMRESAQLEGATFQPASYTRRSGYADVQPRVSMANLERYMASEARKRRLMEAKCLQAARERELLELQACTFKPQTTPVPAYLLRQLQQQYEQQQAHEVQDEGQYDAELNGQYAAHYVADAEGQFEGAGTTVYYDEHGELYYADDVNGELQYNGEVQGYGYGGLDPVADPAAGNMMQHGSPAEMQYEQVGPDMYIPKH